MEDFIRVNELPEYQTMPLDIREGEKLVGQKVRITGGILTGVEGIIKRIGGNKKVIVMIDGLCATAIKYISPQLLVKL